MPRVLFISHSSRIAGAELVMLDVIDGFAGSSVLMLEDGPLLTRLRQSALRVRLSRHAPDMTKLKRDRSLAPAVGLLGRLVIAAIEIVAIGRGHQVLYANSQKAFVLASMAAAFSRRKLIWHLHDILVSEHFGRSQIRLVIWLANRFAGLVIVPSSAARTAFEAAGGRPDLARVVPNGITLPAASPDRDAVRRELDLGDGFVFGVFSRLAPWKGQHVALKALAGMPGARCVIAGAALFGEDDYAESLRRLSAEMGIVERVRFVGARDDVPRLMRAMDAVLHPSIDPEPFGRTLVEAMLSRVPVVATATGSAPEILGDGRYGLLVPPSDADAVARMLDAIGRSPDRMVDMVSEAEAWATARYGAEEMRQAIRKLVRSVVLAPG